MQRNDSSPASNEQINGDTGRATIQKMPSIHMQSLNGMFFKMDILFYNSVKELNSQYLRIAIYHFFCALIFIVFIPINYTVIEGKKDPITLAAMITALVVSLIQGISRLLFRLIPGRDVPNLLKLAKQVEHTDTRQPVTNIKSLQQSVSNTMYNQQNDTHIDSEGLTDKIKKMYESIMVFQIKAMFHQQNCGLKSLYQIAKLLGFVSFVYAIVALAKGQQNTAQLVVLIVYIVLEGLSKIKSLLIIILIALSPLICCGLCCFTICCGSFQFGAQKCKLPATIQATEKDITQAEGTCSICYQDFKLAGDMIKLKCSPKHAFHPLCIESWTKVKPNCPICRTSISGPYAQS